MDQTLYPYNGGSTFFLLNSRNTYSRRTLSRSQCFLSIAQNDNKEPLRTSEFGTHTSRNQFSNESSPSVDGGRQSPRRPSIAIGTCDQRRSLQ
ncbi:hypothetical protein L596_008094 [Steinernema carpocapsae]|nr:hypothetical protein L596_008094 [Steinernema carpocapsae]